jgi:hypothetical protein
MMQITTIDMFEPMYIIWMDVVPVDAIADMSAFFESKLSRHEYYAAGNT